MAARERSPLYGEYVERKYTKRLRTRFLVTSFWGITLKGYIKNHL